MRNRARYFLDCSRIPLKLHPGYLLLVLALGYPAETVVLEEMGADGDVRYWHDAQGVHHVPKRPLEEMLIDPPEVV